MPPFGKLNFGAERYEDVAIERFDLMLVFILKSSVDLSEHASGHNCKGEKNNR